MSSDSNRNSHDDQATQHEAKIMHVTTDAQRIARGVLKSLYGYDDFRKGQLPIVESIANGRDLVAVMSTGFGKSVCFQVPAIMMQGACIVVTPIIALMEDQVRALCELGLSAACVHSGIPFNDRKSVLELFSSNRLKFLYVSPEMLSNDKIAHILAKAVPALVVIDEAHCVSQWGMDFRPAYSQINTAVSKIERISGRRVQRVAFTATATLEVKQDLLKTLGLRDPDIHVGRVRRPNLAFRVIAAERKFDPVALMVRLIADRIDIPQIVYCMSVKKLEMIVAALAEDGINASAYHGKMDYEERKLVSEGFTSGAINLVIATDAFGMGVDRKDVRAVLHFGVPLSLEHYVQQAGRAGRDGQEAECILVYLPSDKFSQEFFLGRAIAPPEDLSSLYEFLVNNTESEFPAAPGALAAKFPEIKSIVSYNHVSVLLGQLFAQGIANRVKVGRFWCFSLIKGRTPSVTQLRERNKALADKARQMLMYGDNKQGCLAQVIDRYLGGSDAVEPPCGKCQSCLPERLIFGKETAAVIRCIKETGRRYGVRVLAMLLTGSNAHYSIRKGRLEKISTFGALRHLKDKEVRILLKSMLGADLIQRSNNFRVGFSETSRGETEYHRFLQSREGRDAFVSGREFEILVSERLIQLRNKLAEQYSCNKEEIWMSATNAIIANKRPLTRQELVSIQGFSAAKLAMYGDQILSLITHLTFSDNNHNVHIIDNNANVMDE